MASSASPRPATTASSRPTDTPPTRSSALTITDEQSANEMARIRGLIDQPAGRDPEPRRGRAVHRGPGPPVREGARPGRDRSRARSPSLILLARLRLGRRGRHAAARRRPRDPDDPGRRLSRRPADRDVHLRPERRDDARPGARDRLLAVHGQPVPRGAPPRADRRRRRSRRPSRRAARPSRSRASRSRSGCRACSSSSRPPCARSGSAARSSSRRSVFYALTFLPAVLGMLGHRVNALSLTGLFDAIRRRLGRPVGVRLAPSRSRWAAVAHCGHGPPARVPHPGRPLPAPRRDAVPAPQPGHPERGRRCPPASRAATPRSPSQTDFRAGRDVADRDPRRRSTATR